MNKKLASYQSNTNTSGKPRFSPADQCRIAACLILGVTFLVPALSLAADDIHVTGAAEVRSTDATGGGERISALEAENARLRQQLQALEAQLSNAGGAQSATPGATPVALAATATAAVAVSASDTDASSSGLYEVVVAASRVKTVTDRTDRLHELKDTPLSISVVAGTDLVREDAFDIGAITRRAANVTWNQGNQRTSSISIRGIGQIGQNEAALPSVGIQIDGVPYAFNPLTSSYNFIDLADVEVTHGPQGTQGGRNNSLGTIAINTNPPTFSPESNYLLSYGERNTLTAQYAAGGSIIDDLLAFRASAGVQRGNGDVRNLYVTDQTYQNIDRATGRLQFLLTPTANFSAKLSLNLTPTTGEWTNNRVINYPTPNYYADGKPYWGIGANGEPTGVLTNDGRLTRSWFTQDPSYTYQGVYLYGAGQRAVAIDGGYPLETGSYGASLNLDWRVGNFDLTSTSAYQTYHFNARNDEGTPFAISSTGGVFDNPYFQYSQEFKVRSTIGTFADYTAGIFLMSTRTNYISISNWLQDAGAWFASQSQYDVLVKNNAGGNGPYLLENSVTGMWKTVTSDSRNKTAALFGQLQFHVTDAVNVTAGARGTYDNRRADGYQLITDQGNGGNLNPVSVNTGPTAVYLGGFATDAKGNLTAPNTLVPAAAALNRGSTQLQVANLVSQTYFGVGNYNNLTAAQKLQVATAQAVRKGQIGLLWKDAVAQTYNRITPTIFFGPSYKFNEEATAYLSYQHGEKAGVAQLVNGLSATTLPERTDAYELGLKTSLLNGTLIANFDVYWMDIHNYIQSVLAFDQYTTNLNHAANPADTNSYYTSATGNVPWVQSRGAEFDLAYQGIPNTTIRLSGAWTDTFYKEFPNGGKSVELGDLPTPYISYTGKVLPGAAKFSADLGGEYRQPLFADKVFHIGFDTLYRSTNNTDPALSSYAWVPGGSITDAQLGFGREDGKFDVSVVVKNLTNNGVPVVKTWNSIQPSFAQWYGLQVTGKL